MSQLSKTLTVKEMIIQDPRVNFMVFCENPSNCSDELVRQLSNKLTKVEQYGNVVAMRHMSGKTQSVIFMEPIHTLVVPVNCRIASTGSDEWYQSVSWPSNEVITKCLPLDTEAETSEGPTAWSMFMSLTNLSANTFDPELVSRAMAGSFKPSPNQQVLNYTQEIKELEDQIVELKLELESVNRLALERAVRIHAVHKALQS